MAAAVAVLGGDGDDELAALELFAHGINALECFRRGGKVVPADDLHADRGMRADQGTLTALDTGGGIPQWNLNCNVAFFILGGGGGPGSIARHL